MSFSNSLPLGSRFLAPLSLNYRVPPLRHMSHWKRMSSRWWSRWRWTPNTPVAVRPPLPAHPTDGAETVHSGATVVGSVISATLTHMADNLNPIFTLTQKIISNTFLFIFTQIHKFSHYLQFFQVLNLQVVFWGFARAPPPHQTHAKPPLHLRCISSWTPQGSGAPLWRSVRPPRESGGTTASCSRCYCSLIRDPRLMFLIWKYVCTTFFWNEAAFRGRIIEPP